MTTTTNDKTNGTTATEVRPVKDAVKASGGLVKVTLGDLRDELGYSRIGKKVLGIMAEYLDDNGFGYFPGGTLSAAVNPEPRQWQEVWVYRRDGSTKSAILDAFADPEENDLVAALALLDVDQGEGVDFSSMTDERRMELIRAIVNS